MAPLLEEWHWDIKKFSIKYTTQKKCQSLLKLSSINLGSGVLDIKQLFVILTKIASVCN